MIPLPIIIMVCLALMIFGFLLLGRHFDKRLDFDTRILDKKYRHNKNVGK